MENGKRSGKGNENRAAQAGRNANGAAPDRKATQSGGEKSRGMMRMDGKETVLLVNFQDPILLAQVKQALVPLNLTMRTVEPAEYGQTIGWLAEGKTDQAVQGLTGISGVPGMSVMSGEMFQTEGLPFPGAEIGAPAGGVPAKETLAGEMLVFAGVSGGRLDEVLAALREKKLRIPYKAVMTAMNRNWTVRQLHREIRAEHEAMTGRKTGK